MSEFIFFGMTPELQTYLDYDPNKEGSDYEEYGRLRDLVQPGLLKTYYRAEMQRHFVPENENVESRKEHLSPSGKYRLVVSDYQTKKGCWSYSQGQVFMVGSDEPLAVVNRNYCVFPFLFVEGHPNGHDYLVCGEDYQGQTVIELDTGKRRNELPDEANAGHGFCWSQYTFDVASKLLVVDGCIWACPYEFRFYDFQDPMSGWPALELDTDLFPEADGYIDADNTPPIIDPDGTIRCSQTVEDEDDDSKRKVVATQFFRREGLRIVLIKEDVTPEEQARRAASIEASRKYDEWLADFRATDPLYLLVKEAKADPVFSPADYDGVGQTYEKWCPDFKGQERRMCHRIAAKGKVKIDLEWAVETGPIKVIVYWPENRTEEKFFPHSVEAMREALAFARTALGSLP